MPNWLNDAVFYEIYPQSFCDTNGDGIGDIEGIISKLDYVKSLGCNAIWLNPIYDSPFMDAGYDVRNYKKVAERYGTNDDLVRLFDEAHKKGHEITHPEWQLPCDHPDCLATAEAMKDIMRFWLDKGADGFRVDMADSLVKNDDDKIATAKIWRGVRDMLDTEYPNAAMVAEWCNPERAINNAGFHMDFYLDHYGNGYSRLFRYGEFGDQAVFNPNGKGDIKAFADEYLPNYEKTKDNGYISFMTNNHDMPRVTAYLDKEAIKLVNAFIFTMPGVPFLYYGDEIGMRYQKGIVSKEGGYSRTGSRTPMQWNSGKNLGFSTSDEPYLAVDKSADAPTVENQKDDPDSIYKVVTDIIALRHKYDDLKGNGELEFMYEEGKIPFAYKRGNLVMYFNPLGESAVMNAKYTGKTVYAIGNAEFANGKVTMSPQSFALVEIDG